MTDGWIPKADNLIEHLAIKEGWNYERKKTELGVAYVFYGQGEPFRGERHEIGQIHLTPTHGIRNEFKWSFSKSKEQIQQDLIAKGRDPDLVNHPGAFPYGLPSENELLPPETILATKWQFEAISKKVKSMLEDNRDKLTDVVDMAATQQPKPASQESVTIINIHVGDKTTVGNISDGTGIAVGTGASANKGAAPQDEN